MVVRRKNVLVVQGVNESVIKRAYKLSLLGLMDKDLADAFDVDWRTIALWKANNEGFAQAVKEGRADASARVAEAIFTRAVGFTKTVQEVKNSGGQATVVEYEKYFPPNITAGMYWLNNRDKERWGNTKKLEVGGTIKHQGVLPYEDMDLSKLSTEELRLAAKMGVALKAKNDKVKETIDMEYAEFNVKEPSPEDEYEDEDEECEE